MIAALLVGVFVVATTYGYYSSHQTITQPKPLIENIQLRSTSVSVTDLDRTGLTLDLKVVVYNPNGFGATLDSANYSVYADGHYLGSGQTTRAYDLAPQSPQTLVFPVTVGWGSALGATARYVVGLGRVTWEVNGSASVEIDGLHLSAPFEFTTG